MAARYTMKTFFGTKQLERFDHRDKSKMKAILSHPRYYMAGKTGPWGEVQENVDRLEIYDNLMFKIFEGNINETLAFFKTIK